MTEDQSYMDSPEEQAEFIHDLAFMNTFCAETSEFDQIQINSDFPELEDLQALLRSFKEMFTAPFASKHLKVAPFEIDLIPGCKLKREYARRVSPQIQLKVDSEISKLLELGIIRKSSSSVCFPIVVVPKPDGSIRLCVDYTNLNSVTVDLRYPMPVMELLMKRLAGKVYFATIDLRMGYHQWLVEEKSIPFTAFITQSGLYEYTRVPFG
jgi:putative transposase